MLCAEWGYQRSESRANGGSVGSRWCRKQKKESMSSKKIGTKTASTFVIANMIGTGVFTSLGFQLVSLTNPIAIALIWLMGGLVALCGAIVYSELGSAMPRSGGEYHYLSVIYHPIVGFMSGWTSLLVGFAAPVALSSMAMSSYLCNIYPALDQKILAMAVLTVITLFHAIDAHVGTKMQNLLTTVKIAIIVVFIVAGLIVAPEGAANFDSVGDFQWGDVFSPAFAVSLVWVYYAYSGWNAAAYISGDIENPQRNVPLALLSSTLFVIVLYLCLNMVFLRTTPVDEMVAQIEIGLISARHIFGIQGGEIMGILITIMLVSSISSMVYVGPRVVVSMGEDHRLFRFLTKKNAKGCPSIAIWTQYLISSVMLLTGSFKLITQYTGVVLSFCALLTVAGVIVHRHRFPDAERPYKTWAYPLPAILFCVIILWTIVYMMYNDYVETFVEGRQDAPWTMILSLGTILTGAFFYWVNKLLESRKKASESIEE